MEERPAKRFKVGKLQVKPNGNIDQGKDFTAPVLQGDTQGGPSPICVEAKSV